MFLPFLITSFLIYRFINLDKDRRILLFTFFVFYTVFILTYQLVVLAHFGNLTVGSDESRYFDVIYNQQYLNEWHLFSNNQSNVIYFWINYIIRMTTNSDYVAIISLRLANSYAYLVTYIVMLDLVKMIQPNVSKKITIFDFLLLLFPFAIYMFSRNVRDTYILLFVILSFKYYFQTILSVKKVKPFMFLVISLFLLSLFRVGFSIVLLSLFALNWCVFQWNPVEKKYAFDFSFLRLLVLISFAGFVVYFNQDYFRNLMQVALIIHSDNAQTAQIYLSSNFQLLVMLIKNSFINIPYFTIEPSLINFLKYSRENDLSVYLTSIDIALVYINSVLNLLVVFPLLTIAFFNLFKKKLDRTYQAVIFTITNFALLVLVLYTSSVGSPDYRTKNFFFIPLILILWIYSFEKNYFSVKKYLLASLISLSLVSIIGMFF